MDALMNTTPGGGGKPVRISTKQIAEVTEKQHSHVLRDTRQMLLVLYSVSGQTFAQLCDGPNLDHVDVEVIRDNRDEYVAEIFLDREHAMTLVTGYDIKLRKRVVDKLSELEQLQPAIPTTAEAFANAFQMLADAERRQAQQDQTIKAIDAKVDLMAQALTILDKLPPNGELVTHLRKRVAKEFGLSFDVINAVLDRSEMHPKFAVRNHHESADGSANYGYWKREVNAVFRRFVDECTQVSPTQCTHPYIEGRFRLIKASK